MNPRCVSVATLFTAGTAFLGAPTLAARSLEAAPSSRQVSASCGNQDPKDAKDAAKTAPAGKTKDGSCGKGGCGSKEPKAAKKGAKKEGADKDKGKKEAAPADTK